MRDTQIEQLINEELQRQQNTIELIASENIISEDIMVAAGSVLSNKYSEGFAVRGLLGTPVKNNPDKLYDYGDKRYYNGCHVIDKIEMLGEDRFRELFETDYHVNLQPHSGAQANMAVFLSILEPGDTVLSMDLSNGGHLSHGSPVNFSGKYYNIVSYGIDENGCIDYNEVRKLAEEHKPKLIICGASNYSKVIDFEEFGKIRDWVKVKSNKCYLLADIAHIAGLVAGKQHPSPFGIADFVTTTTHKSLRGPRGGVVACKEQYARQLDSAVFPGMQGGPLEHIIAAKAVCFYEALQPEFKEYAAQIIKNAHTLCEQLKAGGLDIVGNTTENHLMTVDLRSMNITGKDAANLLDKYGITVNKNTIPNDPQSPFVTSGLRIGVPAVTTRGFKEREMEIVGDCICKIIAHRDDENILNQCKETLMQLCREFPIYPNLKEAVSV